MIVYKRDDLWFWSCSTCHWVEGAFGSLAAAERDAKKHVCRGAA